MSHRELVCHFHKIQEKASRRVNVEKEKNVCVPPAFREVVESLSLELFKNYVD